MTQKLTEIGGLWTCNEQLANFKDQYSEKIYREALMSQISFRKSVLGSKGPKALFQQQIKGKVYITSELEDNLKQIMVLNEDTETETEDPKLKYRPTTEAQEKVGILKSQLKGKVQEGRHKILISQQKDILPKLLETPSLLEGKRVKHKCRDPETREVEWFAGNVLRISKSSQRDCSKTEFAIKYDEDPDEWLFPLIQDLKNGDLIILEN